MNPHPEWEEDYYRLLGIGRGATLSEVAAAYHQSKNAYSKDSPATYSLFTPEENGATLAKLEKAYLTLSNIDKKREYDRWLDREAQNLDTPFSPKSNTPTDMPSFFQNLSGGKSPDTEQPTPSSPASDSAPAAVPHVAAAAKNTVAGAATAADSDLVTTESDVTGVGGMNGPALKHVREKLGLTTEDVCRITKIPSRFLKAIEGTNPDDLPARVYLQGFIKNLAKLYHLDPKVTVESYLTSVPATPPHNLVKTHN
jgi:hypothetical protein